MSINIFLSDKLPEERNKLLTAISFNKKIDYTNNILSVGMSNFNEINEAYNILKSNNKNIALLHCVSSYPTVEKDSNLSVISKLKES